MYVDEVEVDEEGIAEVLMDDTAIAQVTSKLRPNGGKMGNFGVKLIDWKLWINVAEIFFSTIFF